MDRHDNYNNQYRGFLIDQNNCVAGSLALAMYFIFGITTVLLSLVCLL